MANFTIYKKVLMRGEKGDTGGGGNDTTVPQAGIIAYKGDTIPTGYQLYSEVPDGVLTHITATYTQTATITDASSLDDLRPDLVVKAYYYDDETGTTSDYVITNYTLSGTLEVGTSTITASYRGKEDSFNVTVEESITYLYKWDFTQSLIDEIQGVTATLRNSATFTQGVGIVINSDRDALELWDSNYSILKILCKGRTYEIDLKVATKQFSDRHGRLFMTSQTQGFIYRNISSPQWEVYNSGWESYVDTSNDPNVFNGKTAKIVISFDGQTMNVYANDTLIYQGRSILVNPNTEYPFMIGSDNGQSFNNMTITGVRIYENQ